MQSGETRAITIFHSPDADDAFMFYGMVNGAVQVPGYTFDHDLSDIESLNQRTLRGELDVTAISVQALSRCSSQYFVLRCGASMGGSDYGPRIVASTAFDITSFPRRLKIAIPGEQTSSTLALKLYLRALNVDAELVNIHFQEVQSAIQSGMVDCGVIIHEGQITHQREGFHLLADLGAWWWETRKLPLPLGVNVARKSLGLEAARAVYQALRQSIEFSLAHRSAALEYAIPFGRGISLADADTFVDMYVNHRTLDLGDDGIESIELFLREGAEAGFIPQVRALEFIGE